MRFDMKAPSLFFILLFLSQTTFSQKFNTTPIATENLNSDTIKNRIDRLNKKKHLWTFFKLRCGKTYQKVLKTEQTFMLKTRTR